MGAILAQAASRFPAPTRPAQKLADGNRFSSRRPPKGPDRAAELRRFHYSGEFSYHRCVPAPRRVLAAALIFPALCAGPSESRAQSAFPANEYFNEYAKAHPLGRMGMLTQGQAADFQMECIAAIAKVREALVGDDGYRQFIGEGLDELSARLPEISRGAYDPTVAVALVAKFYNMWGNLKYGEGASPDAGYKEALSKFHALADRWSWHAKAVTARYSEESSRACGPKEKSLAELNADLEVIDAGWTTACRAVKALSAKGSLDAVRRKLADPSPKERAKIAFCVQGLALPSGQDFKKDMALLLKDPDDGPKMTAIFYFLLIHDRTQHDAVAALLKDPSSGVRQNALSYLGLMGGHKYKDRIKAMKADSDPKVREAAAKALKNLGL